MTLLIMPQMLCFWFGLLRLRSSAMRFFFTSIMSIVCSSLRSRLITSLCETGRMKYDMLVYG